jgi:L-alanine-DL-glutamate epimerase-like enolase superfamily enzyme
MKITHLECWPVEMKLREPSTAGYETIDKTTNLFIRAQTDTGITGVGCAAPDKNITGETPETVIYAFQSYIYPVLRGSEPFHYMLLHDHLHTKIPEMPSALAMADMMLLDIVAKKAGVPLFMYLGGYRESIPTNYTVGVQPAADTVRKAREGVKQGFGAIKIIGGQNVEDDIERIRKVREAVGMDIELRFDANNGYTFEEAIHFIHVTRDVHIEFIVQPTPRTKNYLLSKVRREVILSDSADESIWNLRDAFKLAGQNLIDMVNVRLMKVGGICEALAINAVAKAAGTETLMGCLNESALGLAAALHVALAQPNVTYADLDGHVISGDDPAAEAIILKKGVLFPTGKPGLGFDFQ